MHNEHCEDYDGYQKRKGKPAYVQKGFRKIWPEDEIMQGKIRCLDEAHNRYKGMTAEDIKELEKDLLEYTNNEGKPLCYLVERDVLTCLKRESTILPCNRAIDRFLSCVDKTVSNVYQSEDRKLKRKAK